MRRLLASSTALAVTIVAAFALTGPANPATAATGPVTLRTDGIGPLKLGMSRTAAVKTGWLSNRGTGCPLGGPPLPISYRLAGAGAPNGITGFAEFNGGKLTNLSFRKGVRTGLGVTVGKTTSASMVSKYRAAGFKAKAQFVSTFGGTFVTVTKGSSNVIGGFASGNVVDTLAIPRVTTCD